MILIINFEQLGTFYMFKLDYFFIPLPMLSIYSETFIYYIMNILIKFELKNSV